MSQDEQFKILVLGQSELEAEVVSCLQLNGNSDVQRAASEKRALDLVRLRRPNVIVLDFDLPRFKPLKFITQAMGEHSGAQILTIAESPSVDNVVKCIKLGVREFIHSPKENQKLEEVLQEIYAHWQALQRGKNFGAKQNEKFNIRNIVAQSPEMQSVLKVVEKVIKRPWVTVLIRGETGTGKEVIARAIHYGGDQNKNRPFIEVNCTAIPESLLESELFGYEKGAFTDARQPKKGLLEMAHEGTLFLDEIGDMNLQLQAKLLKAIEEKRFRRLGGLKDIEVKMRIIAGTNAALEEKVESGAFRSDLYYRLNVINMFLPPLCKRGNDVVILAKHFIQKAADDYEMAPRTLSPTAEGILLAYDWPGNVRELQHSVERLMLLGDSDVIEAEEIVEALGIDEERLEAADGASNSSVARAIRIPREGLSLKDGEKQLVKETLRLTKGNKSLAASILGVSRPRLNRKIDQYGIQL